MRRRQREREVGGLLLLRSKKWRGETIGEGKGGECGEFLDFGVRIRAILPTSNGGHYAKKKINS